MVRPRKMRFISEYPIVSRYIPEDREPSGLAELSVEGLEAIRLTDGEGLDHEAAAALMGISRQTYGRVLTEARQTIAGALLSGKRLQIGGGNHCLHPNGPQGHRRRRRGGHNR
jgi:predicted DNA-binding protein (UPF0251 family)